MGVLGVGGGSPTLLDLRRQSQDFRGPLGNPRGLYYLWVMEMGGEPCLKVLPPSADPEARGSEYFGRIFLRLRPHVSLSLDRPSFWESHT